MLNAFSIAADQRGNATGVRGKLIPHLYEVRRAPVRYHHMLPLPIIKRYQCVVLGASLNNLTVGIIAGENEELLNFLQLLTGTSIFPVLIEPGRMRLLIRRIDRYQRYCQLFGRSYYILLLPAQVHLMQIFMGNRSKG
jgi:hypothetical protein